MFQEEKIYIAGPECFYTGGHQMLAAMRTRAESFGFGVSLPNDHPLDLGNENLQKRADSIFEDLKNVMLETTVIIADLEAFRGSEPDGGTVYELGMAYAKGARCLGYTRDKRPLVWKDQKYVLDHGIVRDEHGKPAPYKELPFSPCVIGSTKIVEGDFDDCLKMLRTDLEETYKIRGLSVGENGAGGAKGAKGAEGAKGVEGAEGAKRAECVEGAKEVEGAEGVEGAQEAKETGKRPRVYLAGWERYDEKALAIYDRMKEICARHGLLAIAPTDWAHGVTKIESSEPFTVAANLFDNYQQHVRDCDAILANLNDYRGCEPSNDVAFECGMAFQLGKKLYGYMDDKRVMKDKIPHQGEENGYRDMAGAGVENFDYPINLMFSSSMKIWEGTFEAIVAKVAEEWNR